MRYLLDATLEDCQQILLGPLLLTIAILFPNLFYASFTTRLITFLAFIAFCISAFQNLVTSNGPITYVAGVLCTWLPISAVVMLLANDPARDFKRIAKNVQEKPHEDETSKTPTYYWQPKPEGLSLKSFDWAFELFSNTRGIGWSFTKPPSQAPGQVKTLYGLDPSKNVRKWWEKAAVTDPCKIGSPSKSSFLLRRALLFILEWLAIDIITFIMDRDPFFQGNEPIRFDTLEGTLLMQYRLLLAGVAIVAVIDFHYQSVVLLAVGIFGDKAGMFGEPWMHPSLWGSPMVIYEKGLTGFWSTFWHPLFKAGYQGVANYLLPNPKPQSQSQSPSKNGFKTILLIYLRVQLVFTLSGLMHASGSAAFPNTQPFHAFISFFLQAPGILIQESLRDLLWKMRVPGWVEKSLLLVFSFAWTLGSMSWFIGDMVKAGLWESRIVPFSFTEWGARTWGCGW